MPSPVPALTAPASPASEASAPAPAVVPRWRRALLCLADVAALVLVAFGLGFLLDVFGVSSAVRAAVATVVVVHVAAWYLLPQWRAFWLAWAGRA